MSKILIAGGTGLLGQRLSALLSQAGHQVMHLSRTRSGKEAYTTFTWDLAKGTIEAEAIEQADYVINLAGAGVADGRWTAARKQAITDSRTEGARLLKRYFETVKRPKAYLSSAAIGIYGDTGDRIVDETATPGTGFLAESCIAWEEAISEVAATGIRTVALRIGIVLSTQGGAMPKMLIPFNFFAGTYFGDGQQWYAWVHIDDVCRMFMHALDKEDMHGFYNAVSPHPLTNKALTEAMAKGMGKTVVLLPAPAFALRTAMGEMADVVLNSNRVSAQKIMDTGFEFQFPAAEAAVRHLQQQKI